MSGYCSTTVPASPAASGMLASWWRLKGKEVLAVPIFPRVYAREERENMIWSRWCCARVGGTMPWRPSPGDDRRRGTPNLPVHHLHLPISNRDAALVVEHTPVIGISLPRSLMPALPDSLTSGPERWWSTVWLMRQQSHRFYLPVVELVTTSLFPRF